MMNESGDVWQGRVLCSLGHALLWSLGQVGSMRSWIERVTR